MSSSQRKGYGFGVATQTQSGQILECSFYSLGLGDAPTNKSDNQFDALLGEDSIRKVKKVAVEVVINLDEKPKDAADVYLRLHLLSHRFVAPHSINLDGIFGLLANVVWTSVGACEVEGFVNFNAGTLGKSMVEGRISAGVVVGDGSDIGGGASIMGTLSGGGKEVISIGERTLLGANSGIGISLGDDCVVEAGVYITAGSKISLPDGSIVKAKELSGANNLLFRRNSQSGALEAVAKSGKWAGLNSALHNN